MSKAPRHFWRLWFSCGRIMWQETPGKGSSVLRTILRWRPTTSAERARHARESFLLDPANHDWS
jgi:hypothetical protein